MLVNGFLRACFLPSKSSFYSFLNNPEGNRITFQNSKVLFLGGRAVVVVVVVVVIMALGSEKPFLNAISQAHPRGLHDYEPTSSSDISGIALIPNSNQGSPKIPFSSLTDSVIWLLEHLSGEISN